MPPEDMQMVRLTREAWEALWTIVRSHPIGSGFTLSDAVMELVRKRNKVRAMP